MVNSKKPKPLKLKTMDEEYEEYIWQDDESIFMPNIGDK